MNIHYFQYDGLLSLSEVYTCIQRYFSRRSLTIDEEGEFMKIKSKEEVVKAYSKRYPELDYYFISNLELEYDKHYEQLKNMKSQKEVEAYFQNEIEKNDASYKDSVGNSGIEDSLNNQYMSILAAYGLIVFFRDTMIDYDIGCE